MDSTQPPHVFQDHYTFEHDPGHGWLCVPVAELRALGIEDKITPFSYAETLPDGTSVAWLEEDLDLSTFAAVRWPEDVSETGYAQFRAACRSRYVDDTHIRNLPPYRSTRAA